MEYDFFAWKDRRQPVWVRTYQRINHWHDNINDETIQAAEYSDGFGRLLQTRALAEDTIFGDATFGSSGLPADPTDPNAAAVGIQRGPNSPVNVRVSGWTVYDNKGRPVEQYEPFFSTSFSYQPVQDAQKGQKARMFYDPRGPVVRTLNPDGSEQRVVFGVPNDLTAPPDLSSVILSGAEVQGYAPTPWEAYTYDANDLSGITHPTESLAYMHHRWTPSNVLVDALGRTKRSTARLEINDLIELEYEYDIRGNVLAIYDALKRVDAYGNKIPVFKHRYNLANQTLWTEHIDAGEKLAVFDVAGKPVYMYDKGKGSAVYSSYDAISRPLKSYARDYATEGFTVRGYTVYGDDPTNGPADPADTNHLGQAYKSYDESGMATVLGFDFKGNPLASTLQVIKDSLLLGAINAGSSSSWDITPYRTDWTETPWDEESTLLEGNYRSDTQYDALNRAVQVTLPEDINTDRKVLMPTYNRAGTAEKVTFDGTEYVKLMAYDAKGQLSLVAFDNELMTRYAYDPLTFRLKRTRTERYEYTQTGNTHEYDYLSGNVRQDLVYDYDLVGNILKQTNLAPDSGIDGTLDGADKLVRMFKYDPLYRLLQATGRESTNQSSSYTWNEVNPISVSDNALNCRAYTQKYEYDKNGRITRMKHTAVGNNYTRKYNYDAYTNRLDSIDNGQTVPTVLSSFGYDNNGNQTTANTERHYEYDAGDMMRAYYNQTSAGVEPTVYAHYVYSGGARTKKLVRTASNEYESVIYLGPFEYHKKVTASTTEEKNYTNVIGGIEIRTGSFTGDITDTVTYSLGDHLGSVCTRVNSGRTIIDTEEYYPYGDSSMRTTDKKRYRYTGKEKDAESKLYYYGARYYTAWACTFTSVDPAAGSTHYQSSYNYADCNPIVMNDPTGMQSEGQTGGDNGESGTNDSSSALGDSDSNISYTKTTKIYRLDADEYVTELEESGAEVTLERGDIVRIEVDGIEYNRAYKKIEDQFWVFAGYRSADGDWYEYSSSQDDSTNTNSIFSELETGSTETGSDVAETDTSSSASKLVEKASKNAIVGYLMTASDASKRLSYVDEAARISAKAYSSVTPTNVKTIAKETFIARETLRTSVQNKLTPWGKAISKAIEGSGKNFEAQFYKLRAKYADNMLKIIQKAGTTNTVMKNAAKASKYLGPIGAAVGVAFTAVDLYQDPSLANFLEEGMGMIGYALGWTLAALLCGFLFVGGAPAWVVLVICAVVAGAFSWAFSKAGRKIGEKI